MCRMFNEKLRAARLASGQTQKATAEMLGVPLRTYEDWEAGRRTPTEFTQNNVIEKISEVIKMDTIKDIKQRYSGEYADVEVYRMSSRSENHFHTDNCSFVDEGYSGSTPVMLYDLMDEEDYNNSINANTDGFDDFSEFYEENAKVLVIGLYPDFDVDYPEEYK